MLYVLLMAAWVVLGAVVGSLDGALAVSSRGPDGRQQAPIGSLQYGVLLLVPLLGIGQWLLLRRTLKRSGWWAIATAIATIPALLVATMGFVVAVGPGGPSADVIPNALALGVAWTVIGFAQWTVLQSQVPLSGLWLLICAAAGSASALGTALAGVDNATSVSALLLAGLAGGAAYGLVSAVGLLTLLAQRNPSEKVGEIG